jgi:hypothetical protein
MSHSLPHRSLTHYLIAPLTHRLISRNQLTSVAWGSILLSDNLKVRKCEGERDGYRISTR